MPLATSAVNSGTVKIIFEDLGRPGRWAGPHPLLTREGHLTEIDLINLKLIFGVEVDKPIFERLIQDKRSLGLR